MEAGERKHVAWASAAAVVAVVVVLTAAGLFVFHSLRQLPADVVADGIEMAGAMRKVAGAFRHGTVETTFVNYAARLNRSTFLQVASLRQMEVYTRKEAGSVLWGQIALPDVVVSATVPVEYTYYLDLDEEWVFELEGAVLSVSAPSIRFNTPALDVSALHFDVRESSLLRDEEAVVEALRAGLTELSSARAQDHVELIRETARRATMEFVEIWLAGAFSDAEDYRVEVLFRDEELSPIVGQPRG